MYYNRKEPPKEPPCASSAIDRADCHLTLLEDDVHDVLDLLCGARGCLVKGRADDQTIGLGVGCQIARHKGTRADSSSILGVQAQSPTDRLTDAHNVHRAHEDHRFQSTDIDALCQNAVMQNHKLLVRILAPLIESIKEHLTIDLLTINECTVLGSNVHHRITFLCQLFGKVSLRKQTDDVLGCLRTNQNLIDRIVLNGLEQILTIALSNILALDRETHLSGNHLGRNDITTLHQFRSRNLSDDIAVDLSIIHTRFEHYIAILGSGSKEVATLCLCSKIFYSRKEVALNRVMCLIKIDSVYLNLCPLQLLQRVVGGEDQFVTRSAGSKPSNITGFGRRIVMRLTTMNVHHRSIGDKLKILTRELLCQQNSRSNHYNGLRGFRQKLIDGIKNTHVGFTTTRRKHTDTLRMLLQSIESILLVGTELHQFLIAYGTIIAENRLWCHPVDGS